MDRSTTPMANLARDIELCLQVQTIPAICGPAGVGKSEMVRAIARRMGVRLFTIIGSMADPTDINGFPTIAQNVAIDCEYNGRKYRVLEFAPPRHMIEANTGPGALFFFDEMTSTIGAVKASMLNLLTQWEAGGYKLNPDKVGFITAYNDPDEAVNGSELGFPMVNRLTHYDWPMCDATIAEWRTEFPSYWGHPKVISFLGKTVPETALVQARSHIAGYLSREPAQWHHTLWEASTRSKEKGKEKEKPRHRAGTSPTTGAATPRSWDRVSRHMALAAAAGQHPLTALRRIIGEIGQGVASSFEVYLNEVQLPDPEKLLAAPEMFTPSGRVDVDFATIMAVAAAVRGDLTPERYEAGWKILYACGGNSKTGKLSYEAGAAGAIQLLPYLATANQDTLAQKIPASKRHDFMSRMLGYQAPYAKVAAAIKGKPKI